MSDTMMPLTHRNFVPSPKERCLGMAAIRRLAERIQAEISARPVDPLAVRLVGIESHPWRLKIFCSTDSRVSIQGVRLSEKSTITSLTVVHTAHVTPEGLVQLFLLSLHRTFSGEGEPWIP